MPPSVRKLSQGLSSWSHESFVALAASVSLLCWGLQAVLLVTHFVMGLYCLALAVLVPLIESYDEPFEDVNPSHVCVDVAGRRLELHMHRGTFYLVASVPIFLSGFSTVPGLLLALAGVRYLFTVYERRGFDLEAEDAGVPLMSTVYP
eukprot:GGOE01041250.1.p1 GENE.GGOE01041250.1~~GGOE01041250.1.p1  ORF type:complete len:148 (-),score=43.40 GGOE01041250.1:203-646(-)